MQIWRSEGKLKRWNMIVRKWVLDWASVMIPAFRVNFGWSLHQWILFKVFRWRFRALSATRRSLRVLFNLNTACNTFLRMILHTLLDLAYAWNSHELYSLVILRIAWRCLYLFLAEYGHRAGLIVTLLHCVALLSKIQKIVQSIVPVILCREMFACRLRWRYTHSLLLRSEVK